MPQVSATIRESSKAIVERISEKEKVSRSHVAGQLLELGLKSHREEKKHLDFLKEITLKNYQNILSTLNIVGELFYIAKGAPSNKFKKDDSVKHVFDTIQKAAKKSADKRVVR